MSATAYQRHLVDFHNTRAKSLLQSVGSLSRDDLEYTVSRVSTLKDERLKQCIAELIKWGDDERAELETMVAIGIEAMKLCSPSRLREAARRVEMRYYLKGVE